MSYSAAGSPVETALAIGERHSSHLPGGTALVKADTRVCSRELDCRTPVLYSTAACRPPASCYDRQRLTAPPLHLQLQTFQPSTPAQRTPSADFEARKTRRPSERAVFRSRRRWRSNRADYSHRGPSTAHPPPSPLSRSVRHPLSWRCRALGP